MACCRRHVVLQVAYIACFVRHPPCIWLFLQSVTIEQRWDWETLAFEIVLQDLVWGLSQLFTGMLSDRFGARPVVTGGELFYG